MPTYYAKATGGNDGNDGLSLANAKTLPGAISVAVSGDIIILDDGRYLGQVITNKSNITFQAKTLRTSVTPSGWAQPHPALGVRAVTIEGFWLVNSPNITFKDIAFTCPFWIDVTTGNYKNASAGWIAVAAAAAGKTWGAPGGTSSIVDWDSTSHSPTFDGCEVYWGYGPTQTPFDVHADYPEYQCGAYATSGHNVSGRGDPYQSWWIDDNDLTGTATPTPDRTTGLVTTPNGRAFNTLANGPRALTSRSNGSAAATYKNVYVHDVSSGLTAQLNNGQTVIDQCYFDRIYKDCIFTATDNATITATAGISMTRNIFEHPFGNAFDSGNPHSDILQHFSGVINVDTSNPIKLRNFRIERNAYFMRNADRAGGQLFFLQGELVKGNPQYRINYTGTIIRDNWAFQLNSNKGLLLNYGEDCYVTNNMFVTPPTGNSSTSTAINVDVNPNTNYGGISLIRDNIVEAYTKLSSHQSENNVSVGKSWSAVSYTDVLTGSFPVAQDTIKAWYAASARKPAYSSRGPRFATIENLALDALIASDIKPFVGWASKQNVPPLTTQTSAKSLIRGPLGENVTVSVSTGQFRVTNPTGTVITDWTSTATAAAVGNYLEVRHTASASGSTTFSQTVTLTHGTLGAFQFTFSSVTFSTLAFPRVKLGEGITPQYTGAMGTSSTKMTFAIQWRPTASVSGSSAYLFGSVNSREPLRIRTIAGTDAIRANAYINGGVNALSGNLDSVGGALGTTKVRLMIISVDTTTGGNGVSAKIFDITDWTDHRTFSNVTIAQPDGLLDVSDISGAAALRSVNHGANGPLPEVDFVFLKMGEWLNTDDPDALAKFAAANIGPRGQGVFNSLPDVSLIGPAADWNNNPTGLNLGTAAKFVIPSGVATDVSVQPWPPQLPVQVTINTEGPYIIGQPITMTVTPVGYARQFNLTCSSNKAGTWADGNVKVINEGRDGTQITFTPTTIDNYTLSFTSDVGYTFNSVNITAVPPAPVAILPGQTVVLTKAQALTLQFITSNEPSGDGKGNVQLRWRRDTSNSGPLDGLNITGNVLGV